MILPIQNTVVFPTMLAPVVVSIPQFVEAAEESSKKHRVVGLLLSNDSSSQTVKIETLNQVGVAARILKRIKLPDGSMNLLIHGVKRFRVKKFVSDKPYLFSEVEYLDDVLEKSNEVDALTKMVINHVKRLSETNPYFTDEMKLAMVNAPNSGVLSDIVAFALSLPPPEAQRCLETLSVKERLRTLLLHLKREQDVSDLQRKIQDEVNGKITTMQREFFLKEQLKAIRKELGMEEDGKSKSLKTYRERLDDLGLPDDVKKVVTEEITKFESLAEQSPEYAVTRNYLDTVFALPWKTETPDNFDIAHARKVLNEDHYGLETVKERILELIAVKKLKNEKGSILCLVGPPGVGKTSVGKSIARALGRNFYRFSLGGMRDESEIKGHRRTYIGAMPGKVLNALKRAGSKNAVLLLDEVDKLGASFQGDPASALLEVLDPEQNGSFVDHYLDLPFDLSKVLFIATANNMSTIPGPLLDRMEVIELSGYTIEEKEKIATRYVIPKVLQEAGLKASQVKIGLEALRAIMRDYAREPGVRSLQQMIQKIARKAALKIVEKKSRAVSVRPKDLQDWLGPKRFYNEIHERITQPGVVTGLAWTAAGGDILFIEATQIPGSGQLKLTGQMGEVMSESANIAWSFVKKKLAEGKKFKNDDLKLHDIHLHIPAGAVPKDGPSAGVTMATALTSLLTRAPAKHKWAMTGELSLTGRVLPVGGIKEKILAAKRVGVTDIILPKINQKDLREVPKYVTRGVKLHWVSQVDDVFKLALTKH